ncbi:MAG TPA: uracil phosphoribosyltransferase, partial [Thermomicrobiales bacterium]|nr:uracil phosphoribosyltransferase [Thermomicrobiales bacterium]
MGQIHVSTHPLVQHKVTLLSDERTDSKTFRELVRELTRLLLYEATADLALTDVEYQTPMETATGHRIGVQIGIVPILRAGLGMVEAA